MIRWLSDPLVQVWINIVLLIGWIALVPVAFMTGLSSSVPFVVALSLIALVVGQAGALTGSLAALEASHTAEQVVEAIVEDERIPTQ